MRDEVSVIWNLGTTWRPEWVPPLIPYYRHIQGHYPAYTVVTRQRDNLFMVSCGHVLGFGFQAVTVMVLVMGHSFSVLFVDYTLFPPHLCSICLSAPVCLRGCFPFTLIPFSCVSRVLSLFLVMSSPCVSCSFFFRNLWFLFCRLQP